MTESGNVGQPGAPEGYPGAGGPGGGGAAAQAPPADAPEFPAFHLVMGIIQGKYEEMNKHVSGKARGDLQKIGMGKLSDEEKAELKQQFGQPQLAAEPRNARGGRQIVLRSETHTITILVKKETAGWKVSELTIRANRGR